MPEIRFYGEYSTVENRTVPSFPGYTVHLKSHAKFSDAYRTLPREVLYASWAPEQGVDPARCAPTAGVPVCGVFFSGDRKRIVGIEVVDSQCGTRGAHVPTRVYLLHQFETDDKKKAAEYRAEQVAVRYGQYNHQPALTVHPLDPDQPILSVAETGVRMRPTPGSGDSVPFDELEIMLINAELDGCFNAALGFDAPKRSNGLLPRFRLGFPGLGQKQG
ncbi:MAG: hypothetical protein AB7G06_05535 [Bdellovibrionales bacterium]